MEQAGPRGLQHHPAHAVYTLTRASPCKSIVEVSAASGLTICRPACRQECERQLDFDLGHLMAAHPSVPDDPAVLQGAPDAVRAFATRATQSLVRQIFSLPSHPSDAGRSVALPPPVLPLPRAKPPPQPKPLTKWQQFAQAKGISKKKKRSKLEYDEQSQGWKRRHGRDKANDASDVPIVEASAADAVRRTVFLCDCPCQLHCSAPDLTCAMTCICIVSWLASALDWMAYQFFCLFGSRRPNGAHPRPSDALRAASACIHAVG